MMTEASENPTGRRSHRWPLAVGSVIGVGALAVTGIAVASIPGQGGVIDGCYNNTNGGLRVVEDSTQSRRRAGRMRRPFSGTKPVPKAPKVPRGCQRWPVPRARRRRACGRS